MSVAEVRLEPSPSAPWLWAHYSFIQQIFLEHSLCGRYQAQRHESNKVFSGTYDLRGDREIITMRCGKGSDGRRQRAVKLRKALTVLQSQGRFQRRRARRSKNRKGRKVMSRCSKQNDLHTQKPGGVKQHGISREMQAVLYGFSGERRGEVTGPAQGQILLRAREQYIN